MWTGKEFLATTQKESFRSPNGLDWQLVGSPIPRQIRRVENWFYGYSWPPHKISRSRDGLQWEPVPNEREWQAKSFAYGPLAGGEPPKLPAAPRPKTPESK